MLRAYSVRDQKAEAFLRPFFAPTRGMAIRSFTDAVNDPAQEMHKHAPDYFLFELGTFNEDSGEFVSMLVSLGNALEFMESRELKVAK